ncbi:D-arabinono-1,4-lactone oxidase [Tothia fuscella]|uniref:D-arabinono-1,4-lactone oxidase n=1 Tax=Tothia fuscella TaxID=1048955 RepID=A0A9P4TZZ4_9PEZI|nr:D-arabinono-1,4-lactone oxidase [Tothia fuscella]
MENPRLQIELDRLDPDVPFRASSRHLHHTWAKTFHSRPELYIQPHTLEEIQKIITLARRCRRRIVLVGSGHSPSDLTCTSSWMVNLDKHNSLLKFDEEKRTLTVQSGIRLRDLNLRANENGLTIPNLGSIDEQSIAGAIATATHGSSIHHGILSQRVQSLRIVLANGATVRCSSTQNPELFRAALVSLGALGIIVEVEFQMVPSTNIEWVQTLKPLDYVTDTWNTDLWTQAEFTRVWWLPYLKRAIVWRAQKTRKEVRAPQSNWYGNAVGFHTYRTLLWMSNYIPWILPTIEWFVFGMQYGFSTESSIDAVEEQRTGLLMNCLYSQFVNEWAIPLSKGPEAITRLSDWINGREKESGIPFSSKGLWVHSPIEVRVADTNKHPGQARPYLDFSCKDEPTLYLNATLYRPYNQDPPCHERYYEAFEWLMKEMGGRPHWAKNFTYTSRSDIEEMYGEDLKEWRRVRRDVDPNGIFVGQWLRRNVVEAPEKEGELFLCEETELGVRNRVTGGVNWIGKQAYDLQAATGRPRSAGSSEESFDHLAGAEAEASTLFDRMSEDDASPVDGDRLYASRGSSKEDRSSAVPFEKM